MEELTTKWVNYVRVSDSNLKKRPLLHSVKEIAIFAGLKKSTLQSKIEKRSVTTLPW